MHASFRLSVRRLVPAAALIVTGASLVAATSAAPATAAAAASPLRMVAPSPTQDIERFKGEPVYLYDLGLFELADQQFEIRTSRTDYAKPVTGSYSIGEGASQVTKALPAGLLTAADRIDKFFALKITDSAGRTVSSKAMGFCPGEGTTARSEPTGASKNPYPYQCGNHPFAQGYVFGIPRGWSVSTLQDYFGNDYFNGKDGTYTVAMAVSPKWRRALGIAEADGSASVKIKVTTLKGDGFGSQSAAATTVHSLQQHAQLEAAHDHAAAAKGVLSPQAVKLEAGRLKALGSASTPKASAPKAVSSKAKAAAFDGPQPDLRSLPAYQILLDNHDANGKATKKTYLQFGATVWNAGDSPLVIDGFRRTGTDLMDAYQYFYDTDGNEVGSTGAGTLQWDGRKGHNHWHFTAFATYTLLDSSRQLTVRSGKEAFCLAPTDGVDLTVKGANWRPGSTDLGTACGTKGAISIREVLDAGWGDTYGQYLPGQSFDVTNLPNGVYYIQVLANPDKVLTESSTDNNAAYRKVKLGGTVGGKRSIHVYPYKLVTAP